MTSRFKGTPWRACGNTVFDNGGEVVTALVLGTVKRGDPQQDRDAAKLFAAGPTMLEALEEISNGECCQTPGCCEESPMCEAMIARAALAKACGEGE